MEDKDIIKALECCLNSPVDCGNCAYTKYPVRDCNTILKNDIADIINRQQAEIEQKDKQIEELVDFQRFCKKKAIKEFAKRLKERFLIVDFAGVSFDAVAVKAIDNLVKEMVGADDGKT